MGARLFIQPGQQMRVEKIEIGGITGLAEKAEETFVIGQMGERRQLQLRERDMMGIEVDREDPRRCRGQIIENIAARRSDGNQPVMGAKLQRIQIHTGVFPDLIIDKALKHKSKEPLQQTSAAGGGG
jgi:hypothetical protein